ncbi:MULTISPECIES: type II toxin-antitoxin system VapB family antitoxin [Vreelandella]|uniref:Type II toxin-antitoxin system VapB family antitoxin n=2 Tax=Vreelandella TaxID=3137766 RepID=A0A3S1DRR1_9GAMM|nr:MULTISPECIES: type II toxin-antitoxin system VapB family antitoxin [Halomonas]RUR32650.1 type II toxin-antitoxin system VapB family antitoxin [Halomonas nanhaiensis]RUR43572.1 type II toxin-antitoxin system VapB family antitoxin [Halomonas populi]
MRITVTIDDALYEQAREHAGQSINTPSELLNEAVKTFVQVQTARRLAALGGTAPEMLDIPRHRGDASKK